MLSTNNTYEFNRDLEGTTKTVDVTIAMYDTDTIPTKSLWFRDMEGESTIKEEQVPDYSKVSADIIDKIQFRWSIPTELQSSSLPADRTGSDPEKFTDFDEKFFKIKQTLSTDKEYTDRHQTLWDKHQESDDNRPD